MKILLDVQYFIALLLLLNIFLVNSDLLVKVYYWCYRKLIKPKFKDHEYAIADGEIVEIIYVLEHEAPYTYFCLPINKNTVIVRYHYKQSELRPTSDLLKALR